MPALMVGERSEDGMAALTLESAAAGGIVATFVPEAGMIGCSLRAGGEELLGQRGGLAKYVGSGSTMGIPFLHPWANRLGASRFELAGRAVDLDRPGLPLKRDGAGLPMHGLLTASGGWVVERHLETDEGGVLAASFDFGAHVLLMEAFPFAHTVELVAALAGAELTIATTVRAGAEGPVPISFGFHPYLRLPGVPRADWVLEAPVDQRLELDQRGLPTGIREPVAIPPAPLADRHYDDAFLAPPGGAPFALSGGGRRLELRIGDGYPYSQIYAPADTDAVAIEPMTAPTNALLSGEALPLLDAGESFTASFSIHVTQG
ncbi:MAG TPA: aldose 1-epimerase [Solirubrobacterales bacterium]|jgi:galactose mutarotase-like enzyme